MLNCAPQIKNLRLNTKFDRDLKALPKDIQLAAKDAIADLLRSPIPTSRRLHALHGYRNPKVFTIDVLSNHSYKISLEIDGVTATLRRIGTHKVLDRAP